MSAFRHSPFWFADEGYEAPCFSRCGNWASYSFRDFFHSNVGAFHRLLYRMFVAALARLKYKDIPIRVGQSNVGRCAMTIWFFSGQAAAYCNVLEDIGPMLNNETAKWVVVKVG